ncbi:MAG: hypothetical protein N3D84_02060 [Candidatus Woesearchaeota archaeon]|nr:hypothetical protein [Candidatus Woesearchaeota archaeon]
MISIENIEKRAEPFKNIFKREDFDYIFNRWNIEGISEIILKKLVSPINPDKYIEDVFKESCQEKLNAFLEHIMSFCKFANSEHIHSMKKGYSMCEDSIYNTIKLFESAHRESIPKGKVNKINKTFLKGLLKIADGARAVFDPLIIGDTSVDTSQLARYMLDNVNGLGRYFVFNKAGDDAAAKKIPLLNIEELVTTERLLLKPAGHVRSIKGFREIGLSKDKARIFIRGRLLGRTQVYFIFKKDGEHDKYENFLRSFKDARDFPFVAAN